MCVAGRKKFRALVNGIGQFVKQPFPARWQRGNVTSMTMLLSRRAMTRLFTLAVLALAGALALAEDTSARYYPDGYRGWRVAKFKLIGPDHPNYEQQGGFRHHYANDVALASWGHFTDGAVIVDERVRAKLESGVWQEAALAHVAVMRKDARFVDTGGWYFDLYRDGDTKTGLTRAQAKQGCFEACHKNVATRDYVFSDPRR